MPGPVLSPTRLNNLAFSFDHWLLAKEADELETTEDDESRLASLRMDIKLQASGASGKTK
jgi:hypothetical protein